MSKKALRPSNDGLKKNKSRREKKDLKSKGSVANEGNLSDADLQTVVGGVTMDVRKVRLGEKSQESLAQDSADCYEGSKELFNAALKVITEHEERKAQVVQRLG